MSTSQAAPISHFLWVEKYRPQNLSDVIVPEDFKNLLLGLVSDGRLPSLLFYSKSPGTGKTTTARALCNELGIKPLFINASVNNSIDDMRTTVIQYATTSSVISSQQRIVILDEADRLSPAAQDALKGIMESVSGHCSFILTCNNKSKVIDPLQSRCTVVDFVYTPEQQLKLSALMMKRSIEILTQENVTFDKAALGKIVKSCVPDNRKLLSLLQQYAKQYKQIDSGLLIFAEKKDIRTFIDALKKKDFNAMLQWCMDNAEQIGDEFYFQIYEDLKPSIKDNSLPAFILILNEFQRYHAIVPDKYLHFTAMSTRVMMEVDFK